MASKKTKKFEQTVSSPYFDSAQGSRLAERLQETIQRFFGAEYPSRPTAQEIADFHLTPREREIAYLAALGFNDKDIADALVMNFQTVRVHLRNILNKMQLENTRDLQHYFPPKSRS